MGETLLQIRDLGKYYGKMKVFDHVDLDIHEGEVVAIIGSSGSGKTTLLRCINLLEPFQEGAIYLSGQEIGYTQKEGKRKRLPERIISAQREWTGMVFQQFNLFPQYTAKENVMLAPKLLAKERPDFKAKKKEIFAQIESEAEDILKRVGLGDKMDNYPCELSGGQQQRVSISRALALNPKILFFDEPTSALDPELTGEILKVIRSLAQKHMTMIIVTHEIEFARNVADRVIFMDEGVVAEDGKPDDVILHPKNKRTQEFLSKILD